MELGTQNRFRFFGTFERFGTKRGWEGQKAEDCGEARKEIDWKIARPTKVKVQ